MRRSQDIVRLRCLILALVGLLGWNILPVRSLTQTAHAATHCTTKSLSTLSLSKAMTNGRIAFARYVDHKSEIFTMNSDGSDVKQLTLAQGSETRDDYTSPVWSPDGSKIAFAHYYLVTVGSNSSDSRNDILVMNADGSNQTRLTSPDGRDSFSAWSPDGSKIAFLRDAYWQRLSGIYVMNADGSNQQRLTDSAADYSLTWSPDGTQIAFGRNNKTYVMNADSSNQRVILDGYMFPKWSPDGLKLAVLQQSEWGIWIANVDGSGLTKIHQATPEPGLPYVSDSDPVWSPDSSKIALTELFCGPDRCFNSDGPARMVVVNADGSNPLEFNASGPNWSPDGTKILFSSDGNLSVMNADGSGLRGLSQNQSDQSPSWQTVLLTPNVINDAQFFVSQHYRDFLNRLPDAEGLAFWTNEIASCGTDQECIDAKRINVSAAFFLSIEFQETGYLVYRMHKAAYGDLPNAPVPIKLNEFLLDTQEIGQGVVVGQSGWQQKLESNKEAFVSALVQRPAFVAAYPTHLTPDQFVDQLFVNAEVTPSAEDRAAAVNEFGAETTASDTSARARALRRVAEDSTLARQEFNKAFVLMQYFGYLRRNPDDAPDNNFAGYNFWMGKLDQFNGDYIGAEMVKSFIVSGEYRQRFGQP